MGRFIVRLSDAQKARAAGSALLGCQARALADDVRGGTSHSWPNAVDRSPFSASGMNVHLRRRAAKPGPVGPGYRWVVLSNNTLAQLLATLNVSSVLIALPAIFRGIHLNPLQQGNFNYLLWILMGYMLVTAVRW